ncbi:disulfide oxidoreductase [Desulfuribacillus stibiiarsenatis]|uniref:Disulfide oxidoreductase n=1 Tax=Desulfuribacillus stibiiarsenatis TaxID=1390249 RepID=A0A1E5LA57_9FIRM|nr:DUF1858 domain-containing protein [Desulfuribacillus stibiiarsenatis]OEH87011.1 disulfide oxidoreductase [Desulfuribacillus stibiiarsenatis]
MAEINAQMTISEVVQKFPESIEVFMSHGLGCVGCSAARYENIAQGAAVHGIDVDTLVADLNAAIKK